MKHQLSQEARKQIHITLNELQVLARMEHNVVVLVQRLLRPFLYCHWSAAAAEVDPYGVVALTYPPRDPRLKLL